MDAAQGRRMDVNPAAPGRAAEVVTVIAVAILAATFAACADPAAPPSRPAASGALLAVSGSADAYTVVTLPTLGGSGGSASGINTTGDVVGASQLPGDRTSHATLWPADGSPPRDLGTLGGIYVNSGAGAINAAGTIVGSSYTADFHHRATLWPAGGGAPRDLGALGGMFTESIALDINDAGDIVGISETPDHLSRRVTLWPAGGGPPRELAGLGGTEAEAYRINAAGDVVGWSQTLDVRRLPTIWPAGGAARAVSGDLFGVAWGINDLGDIVGTGQLGPTVWPAGGGPPRALGGLGGAGNAIALAINASGDVVGATGSQATLWPAGGAPIALPTPDGTSGSGAWRIDNDGRIVGSVATADRASRAAVWRPASAPAPGAVPVGRNVEVTPVDRTTGQAAPVRLTFATVTTSGIASVTSGEVGSGGTPTAPPAPPSANFRLGDPPLYYDITTTATFTGSVRDCVTYPVDAFASASNLALLHYENAAWVALPDQTVDPSTRTVCGSTTSLSPFMIAEVERAPVVTRLSLPVAAIRVNEPALLRATFTDENERDTHSGHFSWSGGGAAGAVDESGGSGTLTLSQAFGAPGLYAITASVTDGDLAGSRSSALDVPSYLVVYDPRGGFVTGGGWIDSPAGAYVARPTATGKATFALGAKYLRGADKPSAIVELHLHAAGLRFRSMSAEWLVVADGRAHYKGEGMLNGSSGYAFLVTTVDGRAAGGRDAFRIKIWEKATGTVVYDNQMGQAETGAAATALGGGSIQIHNK